MYQKWLEILRRILSVRNTKRGEEGGGESSRQSTHCGRQQMVSQSSIHQAQTHTKLVNWSDGSYLWSVAFGMWRWRSLQTDSTKIERYMKRRRYVCLLCRLVDDCARLFCVRAFVCGTREFISHYFFFFWCASIDGARTRTFIFASAICRAEDFL